MKTKSLLLRAVTFLPYLVLLFLVISITNASAQVSAYNVSTFNGEYVSIANDDISSSFAQDYDDGTASNSLPFDFTYDGTLISSGTSFVFCSNGFLTIGSDPGAVPDFVNYGVADNVSNCILPFSGDLVLNDFNGSGGSFAGFLEVTGTAPNRVATFEWQDFIIYSYDGYTSGGMQVKLYEGSNVIEFLYANPGYAFSGDILPSQGSFSDPCAFSVGLNGNPYSSDNNLYTTNASALPSSDLRFTPPIPLNIQLAVSPKNLSFGSVDAGTSSSPQCIDVQNVGTLGTLTINSATITGSSDFQIVSSPPSNNYNVGDPAGQYCIIFSPTNSGLESATLNIASNGQDSGVQTVILSGAGTVADYTIDSLTKFKKTKTKLGDSLTQYLHITSTGQSPLFFSSFSLSGLDAGQYVISYYPTNPLPPGQSDSIGITYIPTLEGRHTATLTLLSNAFLNPSVSISLQGTGILPHIVLTPTILQFDSTREGDTACKNIDIWNPGSDTLIIHSNYLSSNDGDFHYAGLDAENSHIPPDNHKTVTVCFTPIQRGTRQARLFIKTNIINTFETPRRDTASTLTVDISGNGLPFGVFGTSLGGSRFTDSAIIGKTVCRTDTLKNTGDGDIIVTGISVVGTQFTYSNLPAFPFLLKAHNSVTFSVCGTPDQQGLLSGTITFTGTTSNSNINTVLAVNIYGFKTCLSPNPISLFDTTILPNDGSTATICDTIQNCGDIDAIYHVAINGLSKADYSVSPAVSGIVPAKGGTTIFCVTYKPSAVGVSRASLDVTAEDGSSSVSVPLAGSDGCAVLTNDPPVIPATGDNASQAFSFNISNASGSFEWNPNTGHIAGQDSAAFIIDSIVPSPIPAGGTGTVYMHFHPPLGSQGSTLTGILTWPNAGPCGNSLTITLNGSAIVNSVKELNLDGFSLDQSYPNPTQGAASFNYTTPKESIVRIVLADMTGKIIRTLITGRVSEGLHTVNFDVRDLSSGTYVYLLESGTTRLVRQFILAK